MSNEAGTRISVHEVVPRDEWMERRRELLAREKEFTRARDELSRQRRELPWVRVDKNYVFDSPRGPVQLADLFEGRSQLIVYHFMWRWDLGQGCPSCSFFADHVDGANIHLANHDVTFVAISRGRHADLEAY